jgi:hypothetical protein
MKTSMRLFRKAMAMMAVIGIAMACNEEDNGPSIALSILKVSDSNRSLTWNEIENADGYRIWRTVKRSGVLHEPALIASVDFLTLHHVDENVPLAEELLYYIVTTVNNREVRSNVVSSDGATYLLIHPYQMKLLPDENLAVVRDYSTMLLVDYENQVIAGRREFNGKLGAFDMGTFNGKKEMYVPCSDHSIYIMDPYELTMIDTLIADYPVASVAVNSKGTIYYSCSDPQTPLKLYDRGTMQFISKHAGGSDSGILLQSDNRLLTVTTHISPATMSFYTFGDGGNLLSRSDDPYSWDYEMDSERLKMSSKYIVTSTEGFVYAADDNLTWITTLTRGGSNQTDFEFSEDGETIYSAVSSSRVIYKQLVNGGSSSIATRGYPWVMARNGNELIVLSAPDPFSPGMTTNAVIIERIALN